MNPDQSPQNLFNEALERQDAAERARFLDDACGADAALRERVEKLLRAHDEAGGFLSRPSRPAHTSVASALPLPVTEKAGDRIGRYKLLQQIGEGGCGVVYMAEQEEPVRRRVALKVIKLGMDTKQVIARFEAERQALALMDHPNIARVLDAGATETGRPYFVMELVRGTKITEFCDEKELATHERLDLFLQVCSAVQHAHRKGIIHRDIKPSNILVTVVDGAPVPKVIDFGIAKATNNQQLTDKTLFTAFEQFIGTPAYMSPEQAELSGVDIDTRTDIYSLGVVLYELLTGSTPFDQKDLLAAGLEEMRRTIREKEPARPSNRLSTMAAAALTTTAHHRLTEPPKLVQLVRGDLDWIAMKCLEKERDRRYETATALAADIRSHLENEPVAARPPSRLYEFRKTVRRHKVGFAAAGAVILSLAAGLGISTWTLVKEKQARGRAVAAEKAAQDSATQAEQETKRAEKNATEAHEQRQQAEALAENKRLNLYAARIKLAAQAIADGDVPFAQELLESLRPHQDEEDLRSFDWHYLHQLGSNEKRALTKVGGRVRSVAFSPDGRLLAAAGEDRIVRLWDNALGLRAELKGHTGEVAAIAFAPDSATLASTGADGTVRIWNVSEKRQLHCLQASTNALMVMAFSPDGARLAIAEGCMPGFGENAFTRYAKCSKQGRIQLWNTKTHQLERILDTHGHDALSVAFSSDGRQLAAGGIHNTLVLFDVATGEQLPVQTTLHAPVFATLFLPDREIVAASWDPYQDSGRITVLDAATLEPKRTMLAAGKVTCLALSPDGRTLAAAGPDRVLRLRDVATGQETGVFHGHKSEIWSVAYSPDGKTVATGGFDDAIRIWDPVNNPARQRITTPGAFSIAFSPDGSLLASSGAGVVDIRDPATGDRLRSLTNYGAGDLRVTFSPDGSILAATGNDQEVHFWDVRTWKHWMPRKEDMATPPDGTHFVPDSQFAFSPDSTTLARAGTDGIVRLWDSRSGALVSKIAEGAYSVGYAADGTQLIIGGGSEIRVWNTRTNQVEKRIAESGALLRISKNGRWFASGGSSRISVRELPAFTVVQTLRPSREELYCVSFSHDGKILATASWDGTVKLWQVATGQELFTIPSFSGIVWAVTFSPDDRTLAFAARGEINILRCAPAEKWATTLTEQANKHWKTGKANEAEKAFREALELRRQRVPRADPSIFDTIFNLVKTLQCQGKLEEAETLLRELIELRPGDHYAYYHLAATLIQKGDAEAHRQLCARIVERFATTTDPPTAERMGKSCLIHPVFGATLEAGSKLADTAVAVDEADVGLAYYQFVKGLAEYRQGRFTHSVEWMQKALRRPGVLGRDATAYLVLAMAEHQLRHAEAARTAFGKGAELVERNSPKFERGEVRGDWVDWPFAQALLREARPLIEGK